MIEKTLHLSARIELMLSFDILCEKIYTFPRIRAIHQWWTGSVKCKTGSKRVHIKRNSMICIV